MRPRIATIATLESICLCWDFSVLKAGSSCKNASPPSRNSHNRNGIRKNAVFGEIVKAPRHRTNATPIMPT